MVRLTLYECKKILQQKSGLLLFLCALVSVWYFAIDVFSSKIGDQFTPDAYRALVSAIDAEQLSETYDQMNAAYEGMLWDGKEPETMYASSLREEMFLYDQVLEEIDQVLGYEEYLVSVRKQGERQNSVSLFGKSKQELRNLDKTVADFENMQGTSAIFCGTYGVNLFMKTDLTDLLAGFVILLIVALLVPAEVESGRLKVVYAAVRGRSCTAYAKYLAGLWLLTGYAAVAYGVRLLVVLGAYGLGDSAAAFQSVYGAQSCTLRISVGGAVALFLLLKLLALYAVFSFIFILSIWLCHAKPFYCVAMGMMGVGFFAYVMIDTNSYLSYWKWVNPVAVFYTGNLLMDYKNLMIGSIPVNYRTIVVGICLAVITAALLTAGICYPKKRYAKKPVLSEKGYAQAEKAAVCLLGGRTVGGYEFRKWTFYQKGLLICLAAGAVACLVYAPADEKLYTQTEIAYKNYVKQVEGVFQEEKLQSLYEEQERLTAIEEQIKLHGEEYSDAVLVYYQKELLKKQGLLAVIEYGEYLQGTDGGLFIYEQGYEMLLGEGDGGIRLFWYRLFALATEALLAVLIWGMEAETGMQVLLTVTETGIRKINRRKRVQILLSGAIVSGIVYIPWIYSVLSIFGTVGINGPACSLMRFSGIPSWVTLSLVLFLFYLLHVAYLWLAGFAMQFAYGRIKSPIPAAIAVFGVFMLPILIAGG